MKVSSLRILIADDHTIFRQGIKQMLLEFPEIERVDEASSATEVFQSISNNDYDCLLLDIFMPGRSGIDILKQINEFNPALPVLILSMYHEDMFGIRTIKAGADGYLMKNCSLEDLRKAICQVCRGDKFISSHLANRLAVEVRNESKKRPHEQLTDRQLQILIMISSGTRVSQIAQELSLSVKTINTHRANILQKMKMQNNAQLIRYALTQNLIF